MLKLIYGSFGSGKTYCSDSMILDALRNGKRPVLLVPEQEVMEAERRIADRADAAGVYCENLTVVSFRRLANLAFRKYGGIEYGYLDDGGRLAVIWRILEELSPVLHAYKNSRDRALTELMLSVCDELKRYSVSPLALSRLYDTLPPSLLKDKLSDITLVYSAFTGMLGGEYPDSADDVTRLAELLKAEDFLSGSLVFLDSFNGFTVPELSVIEFALKQCDVTVTLGLPEEKDATGFKTLSETKRALTELAKKHNIPIHGSARLTPLEKYIPEEFRLISSRLWDFSYSSPEGVRSDRITLAVAPDAFAEAEFTAIKICELVRSGARYRDIAVVSRRTDVFDGIYDAVFKRYGIPFFFSRRTGIASTALFRTVSSALEIISGGWKLNDVLVYVKTGICGFNAAETDILESYAVKWSINGKRWTDEYEWNMNPSGYTDRLTAADAELLKKVNALRERLRLPLIKLRDSLKGVSLKEAAVAICVFITECGIYEKYSASLRPEDKTVYNTFISLLEAATRVAGDVPVNASVLSSLLTMMGSRVDFGRIPENIDCVKAGDASVMRLNGIKHIFLSSCESGVFPKAAEDGSVFTDAEKEILARGGIRLSPDTATKNDEEMFFFLRSACSAVQTLTLTYSLTDGKPYPSIGFTRIKSLFPANEIIHYPGDLSPLYRIQNAATGKEIALSVYGTPLFDTLKRLYTERGEEAFLSTAPLSNPSASVSKDITEALYKNEFTLSQSRIESFVKCPFSYYCKYILKLEEKKRADFMSSDKGSYIHRILEKVVAVLFADGRRKSVTDAELKEITDSAVKEVLESIFGGGSVLNLRFAALIERLNRTVMLLVKNILAEFESSDFSPKFFELNIGKRDHGAAPFAVTLEGGDVLKINGVIDRVDTYEKNGDVYVRVVDYKTGSRAHSTENIKHGLDMQMLLYLFALYNTDAPEFRRALGVGENGKIRPAGVLYQPSYIPILNVDAPTDSETALSLFRGKLVRSGILLDDPEILDAMEHGLNGKFIPVTEKNHKKYVSDGKLRTSEGFNALMLEITDILRDIGRRLRGGEASAVPLKAKAVNACDYCNMRPVCRISACKSDF